MTDVQIWYKIVFILVPGCSSLRLELLISWALRGGILFLVSCVVPPLNWLLALLVQDMKPYLVYVLRLKIPLFLVRGLSPTADCL